MTPPPKTISGALLGLLIVAISLPSMACEGFEPERFPVGDTVVLHSLARPAFIGEPSAFDFYNTTSVVVERPSEGTFETFDMAFSETEEAGFVALPAGLFESFEVEPGIAPLDEGATFDGVEQAPSEGYVTDSAVPLTEGAVYAVRTRRLGSCIRYAKFEVVELQADGLLEFRYLVNNLCNDRNVTDVDAD